jgi:hypothetical protein
MHLLHAYRVHLDQLLQFLETLIAVLSLPSARAGAPIVVEAAASGSASEPVEEAVARVVNDVVAKSPAPPPPPPAGEQWQSGTGQPLAGGCHIVFVMFMCLYPCLACSCQEAVYWHHQPQAKGGAGGLPASSSVVDHQQLQGCCSSLDVCTTCC